MPAAVPFLVSFAISLAISIALSAVMAGIQLIFAKKQKRQRQSGQDRRQKQNITDTIGQIPVVYGRARVAGSRVFAATKLAYTGLDPIYEQGQLIWLDSRGDYLYLAIAYCEGEIEKFEDILIDGVSWFDGKFTTRYENDVSLSWTFTEPSPVTVYSQVYDQYSKGNSSYKKIAIQPIRYRLFRRPVGGQWIQIWQSIGGVSQTLSLPNHGYGDYEYELYYYDDSGNIILVGNATVHLDQDNLLFTQTVDNNLTFTQNSFIASEYLKVETRKGGADNLDPLPSWWLNEVPEYGTDRIGHGVAYLLIRILKHTSGSRAESTPIQSIPDITAIVKGKLVLDTRDDTIKYTSNPALCIRDYLSSEIYGARISSFHEDAIKDTADYCDELVTRKDGSQTARFSLDGVVFTDETIVDNVEKLLQTCNGSIVYQSGLYKIFAQRASSVVKSFDASNIIGNIQVNRASLKDKQNGVKIRWVNPATWDLDMANISSPEYLAQDKNKVLESEMQLDFVTNYDRAVALGTQLLKQSRKDKSITFKTFFDSYDLQVGDVIDITHEAFGWTSKEFRITKMIVTPEGEIEISALEYDDLVYDIDDYDLELAYSDSTLDSPFNVLPPSALRAYQTFEPNANGDYVAVLQLYWYRSTSSSVVSYQIEKRNHSVGSFEVVGQTPNTILKLYDMPLGVYDFRVKAINSIGYESIYTESLIEVVSIDQIPPDVQGLFLKNGLNTVTLTWQYMPEVATNGFFKIRHIPATTGAQWSDHPTFEHIVSGKVTEITLPQLDGTYMIKAVNIARLESANETSIVLDLPDDTSYQKVLDVQEDITFTGSKVQCDVIDDVLTLGYAELFDSDEMFDSDELFDGTSITYNVGTYNFANSVDLGAVYKFKLTKTVVANLISNDDSFDSDELFDSEELFDGSTVIGTIANLLYRTTRDDPSSSPTWSDWKLLTVNEDTARAVEFRLEMFTNTQREQIEIEQLRTHLYLPLRVESKTASITGANQLVSFNKAFYNTPDISVSILDPAAGDYFAYAGLDEDSFNITCRDSGANTVSRSINYTVQGLGERVV